MDNIFLSPEKHKIGNGEDVISRAEPLIMESQGYFEEKAEEQSMVLAWRLHIFLKATCSCMEWQDAWDILPQEIVFWGIPILENCKQSELKEVGQAFQPLVSGAPCYVE